MDRLTELSKTLKTSIKTQYRIDISGEASFQGIQKTYRKHAIQIDLYKTFILVTIAANSDLAMAINSPDRMFGYKVPVHIDNAPYPVYVSDDPGSFLNDNKGKDFLNDVFVFLKTLDLSANESAHFYNNGLRFIFNPERDIKGILDDLIDVIIKNDQVFKSGSKPVLSKKNIPDNLKILVPLIKKYAVADDSKRSLLVEKMSVKQRKELIEAVRPHFPTINSYLDSFGDRPLSEEATLIGNLAELVSELMLE